jgi:hypothetical protein
MCRLPCLFLFYLFLSDDDPFSGSAPFCRTAKPRMVINFIITTRKNNTGPCFFFATMADGEDRDVDGSQ